MVRHGFRELRLNDPMPFGKHKDKTLKNIIDTHPTYITWLIINTNATLHTGADGYYRYKLNNKIK